MNTNSISPTLPIRGFVNESATALTPGMGVASGTGADKVTIGAADATVKGVVALDMSTPQNGIVSLHIGHGGTCYVQSGAAFAVDAPLMLNAAGLWVTATSGKKIQAVALAAAAGANELVPAIRHSGLDLAA